MVPSIIYLFFFFFGIQDREGRKLRQDEREGNGRGGEQRKVMVKGRMDRGRGESYLHLSFIICTMSSIACLYALMITVGCICCSKKGSETAIISPAKMKKIITLFKLSWLNGRVLAYGVEGTRIEICTGPKISCYACCVLGHGTLLSFASLT